MRVAVLIPATAERPHCLDALDRQTRPPDEVIVSTLAPVKLHDHPNVDRILNIARNRAVLRNKALTTDATHFLLLDSDVTLPPHAVAALVRHALPVVGGWYPQRNKVYWSAGWFTDTGIVMARGVEPGLAGVNIVGLGCCLIRRDVLERVEFPHGTDRTTRLPNGMQIMYGNCMAFGVECKANNIPMHMTADVVCGHER